MKRSDYEEMVKQRCQSYVDVPYCVIALNGEAGEVAEWYKKFVLRGNVTGKYTVEDLKIELGDVLFYLTALASRYGWSLDEIMEANFEKLRIRDDKKMKMVV
jgi:NTP pyrophosphatase (non-canonical NTP hydrolase)